MATSLGTVQFDTYASYELAYDLLGQSTSGNYSNVRLYGILHVTGNSISWSSGSASVHTSGLQGIGTYYSRGDYVVITRDFTFTHDNNGNFSAYIGASISTTYKSGSCGGTLTLPHINRYPVLNSGQNFNDEQNPVYNITSYNTFPIRIKLEAGGNAQLITRDVPASTNGNYTLQLTSAERNTLRALCPNSNTLAVTETVCAMNGNTELSASYKRYTMTIVNANPTFSNFTFEDTNSTTIALTGNNQRIIKGYSNVKVTISSENKATANKQATMSKYQFVCGNATKDISYSSSSSVNGTINKVTSRTFDVYAIDSRNNSKKVTKTGTSLISYTNISLDKQNSSITRNNNGVGESAILTLNGKMWNGDFGATTNSIQSVTYKLKKTDSSTWINGTTTITPIVDNSGNISFTGEIASDNQNTHWDLESAYNIQVKITDKLSSYTIDFILNGGVPTISFDKEGVGIMCKYDTSIGGSLQVNGSIVDGGKILWTNSNHTSNFNSQTINLSNSDYDTYEILYKVTTSESDGNRMKTSGRLLKGYGTRLSVSYASEGGSAVTSRAVNYVSDTSLLFGAGYSATGATQRTQNNGVIIPLYIVGYKTNLFS